VTTRLVDRPSLALWHLQAGFEPGLFQVDRQWSIGDRAGAPVGTVFVDGDVLDLPDYWVREADGSPAIGVGHADGLLASVNDPWHRVVWADGAQVGLFRDVHVHWQDRPIAKWQVKVTRSGRRVTLEGAWLWDPQDAVIASVHNVESPGEGAYLTLDREEELDEALCWAALALPLVAYEHYRRSVTAANRRRRRLH
jgi:hypothetical protein